MKAPVPSYFAASLLGGAVVAAALLALGVSGGSTTQTIIEESPIAPHPASSQNPSLTPHAIYEQDAPGVVFVRAQIVQPVQDPFDLFEPAQSSVSTGSGFLIDPRGYLLTNYHLIAGADRRGGVSVQFQDNTARSATVIGEDPADDLAVLKINMNGVSPVRPLPLGDSTTVRVGDPTLAIGNPFGLDRTLTSGIVSALQRQIQAPNGFAIANVIQTDTPINPGNSGGPLLDATGKVIGINSQIETGGANGSVGIAFAVPINTATDVLPRLRHDRRGNLAYLGFRGGAAPGVRGGVVVESTAAGGPADSAGLHRGDEVVAIAGRPVRTMKQINEVVGAQAPGLRVPLHVRRSGHFRTVVVMLGTQPASRAH